MTAAGDGNLAAAARIGWLLVAALGIAGYARVVVPAEQAVRDSQTHAHALYDLAYRNERMIDQAAALQAARARVKRDLAQLGVENGVGKASLAFLRLMQAESKSHQVVLSALSPGGAGVAETASGTQRLDIALRGSYRELLATLSDISKHDVLFDVDGVELSSTGSFGGDVDATLHATLYHGMTAIVSQEGSANGQTVVR
jgi:hypothetical protein